MISRWNAQFAPQSRRVKYKKMIASPFAFFRGTNHLFWNDFANDIRLTQFGNAQTRIWIQGDLHAENFGTYDTAQGTIVYDLNDFDEAVIADYQYDLWRMAVSIVLIARQQRIDVSSQKNILDAFAQSYLKALERVIDDNEETHTVLTKKNANPNTTNITINPRACFVNIGEKSTLTSSCCGDITSPIDTVFSFNNCCP